MKDNYKSSIFNFQLDDMKETITLRQAWDMWRMLPENMQWATKSRRVFSDLVLNMHGNKLLTDFGKKMTQNILFETDDIDSRTKAASLLVDILTWGSKEGYCRKPMFDETVAESKNENENHNGDENEDENENSSADLELDKPEDGRRCAVAIDAELYERLDKLGLIPNDVRDHNVGESDYSQHVIQPWSIWQDYDLNSFDGDIVKRVLRHKSTDPRSKDYKKIIHVCQECLRQMGIHTKLLERKEVGGKIVWVRV